MNVIFKAYDSEKTKVIFYKWFFIASLIFGLIALAGFFSGLEISATLSGLAFIFGIAFLSLDERFRRSPFAVLLCFYTLLFLSAPTAFILFLGKNYIFGDSIGDLPYDQSEYFHSLSNGYLFLLVCWFAMWIAIRLTSRPRKPLGRKSLKSIRPAALLLMSVVVLFIIGMDNQGIIDSRVLGAERNSSIAAFIFFDHAYLILAGLILFFMINDFKNTKNSSQAAFVTFILFFGFTFLMFAAGSKAAALGIFYLLVLLPFSYSRIFEKVKIVLPSAKFLMVVVVASPILFFLAFLQRMSVAEGMTPDLNTLMEGVSKIDFTAAYEVMRQIVYRFCQGGLDQFLLISHSFIANGFDADTAINFISYLSKNTWNLIMPGTPFPEAYAPSSQLLSQVIEKNLRGIFQGADARALLVSFNTQPYTIFGVFVVLVGLFAPIAVFLSTLLFISFYNRIRSDFLKITLLYFFFMSLPSFGIEAVFGNSVHLLVSMLIMYGMMNVFSRLRGQPRRVSKPIEGTT